MLSWGMISIGRQPLQLGPHDLAALQQGVAAQLPWFAARTAASVNAELITQPFFSFHRIVEICSQVPHPAQSVHVAFLPTGQVCVLTANLAGFCGMAAADPPTPLTDQQTAQIYANLADYWTTENTAYGELLLNSLDEIPWQADLDEVDRVVVETLQEEVAQHVAPPRAELQDGIWQMHKWVLTASKLLHRQLRVTPAGQVSRHDELVDQELPVPPGQYWGMVDGRLVPVG